MPPPNCRSAPCHRGGFDVTDRRRARQHFREMHVIEATKEMVYFSMNAQNPLERFLTLLNRRVFPSLRFSDSGYMLVLEAGMHGTSIVGGPAKQSCGGDRGRSVATAGGGAVCERGERDPLAAARRPTRDAKATAAVLVSSYGADEEQYQKLMTFSTVGGHCQTGKWSG